MPSLATASQRGSARMVRSEPSPREGFRVRTFLRELRGRLTLREAAWQTRIAKGELSLIERGYLLPREELAARMETVYGPRERWYPSTVMRAIAGDVRACSRCGGDLPPSASRRQKYHHGECPA